MSDVLPDGVFHFSQGGIGERTTSGDTEQVKRNDLEPYLSSTGGRYLVV